MKEKVLTTQKQELAQEVTKLLRNAHFINETEVPAVQIPSAKWRTVFNEIPVGKALVLEGHEAVSAYTAMRKFKNRTSDFSDFEGVKRHDKVYIVHKLKEGS